MDNAKISQKITDLCSLVYSNIKTTEQTIKIAEANYNREAALYSKINLWALQAIYNTLLEIAPSDVRELHLRYDEIVARFNEAVKKQFGEASE